MTGRLQYKVGLDDGLSALNGADLCPFIPNSLRSLQEPARESNVSNIPDNRHERAIPNSGIGLESSLLFAKEGASLLLTDINLPAVEKAASLINQRFPNVKALAVKADVAKEQDIKSAVEVAVKEFGRLDIMVRDHLDHFVGDLHSPIFSVQQCWRVGYICHIQAFLLIQIQESCIQKTTMPSTRRSGSGTSQCRSTPRAFGGGASMRFSRCVKILWTSQRAFVLEEASSTRRAS